MNESQYLRKREKKRKYQKRLAENDWQNVLEELHRAVQDAAVWAGFHYESDTRNTFSSLYRPSEPRPTLQYIRFTPTYYLHIIAHVQQQELLFSQGQQCSS